MTAPSEMSESETRIAEFTVLELLADDDRSRRYAAATDDGTPVEVTVSVHPPDNLGLGHFRREVEVATRLRVPGIVPVLDGGVHDGAAYVVEARVDGTPLVDLLAQGPSGARAVDVLRPAAQALDALHAGGQVHHLLTPAALVVDGAGGTHLRLTGLQRFFPEPVDSTDAGDLGERPVYQAPETFAGAIVSHRSDLYAFACVAFEVVTATPPFTLNGVLGRRFGPPRASDRLPGLPPAVDEVFRRALDPNAMNRHPSATDLVDELQSAFGASYRPTADRSLRRLVWLTGVAAVLGLVALVVALIVA